MGYGKGNIGRPIGTSKYPYRLDQERELVVRYVKQGMTNDEIALLVGWHTDEVRNTRAIFFPTQGLAKDYLKANALRLAMRIVEEANVEEAVDILSRPNIGVLKPAEKPNSRPNIGIITNINTATLGGVQTSTALLQSAPDDVIDADDAPDDDAVPVPVPLPTPTPDPKGLLLPCTTPPAPAVPTASPKPARRSTRNRPPARAKSTRNAPSPRASSPSTRKSTRPRFPSSRGSRKTPSDRPRR